MNKALKIFSILNKEYPLAKTALRFSNPWQILVATILSAQCTDTRVNIITKDLFKKYPHVEDYINMKPELLIKYIKSAGFYKNKSKSILGAAKMLKNDFKSKVPNTMDEMLALPGVARKTANVVLGSAYNTAEGIAVDTHVKRVTFRLGLTEEKNPDKIERDLMDQLPQNKWIMITFLLIEHGRAACRAPKPFCSECVLNKTCPKKGVIKSA